METTIKPNKDNNLKFLGGIGPNVSINPGAKPKDKDQEEKKESTDEKFGDLEYFCE